MKKRLVAIGAALALVAVLVVPAVAMAGNTTQIGGNISAELELTAPGDINLNLGGASATSMEIGANTGTATDGSVKCNDPAGYTVTVKSDKSDGKMTSGTYTLQNALQVTTGSYGPDAVTTTTPVAAIVDTSAPGESAITLSVSQTIVYADPTASNYGLTLTYTASAK